MALEAFLVVIGEQRHEEPLKKVHVAASSHGVMAAPSPPAPVAATGQELLEGYKRSRIDKRFVRLAGQMGTDVR